MTENNKITTMKKGGQIASFILGKCLETIKPGISTWEINQLAEKLIKENHVFPAFKTVRGYPCATCITVNNEVVHGLPKKEKIIKAGDIVTIDLGVGHQNFCVDTGWTLLVGKDKKKEFFLKAGKKALDKAVKECVKGKTVGSISFAIQNSLEKSGLVPEVELVGHGVGEKLHQKPDVPCVGTAGLGPKLRPGMTLAIEIIYKSGRSRLYPSSDNWTLSAKDGILTALFELTVAVGNDRPIIITPPPSFNQR